jgi:hypothetical protein
MGDWRRGSLVAERRESCPDYRRAETLPQAEFLKNFVAKTIGRVAGGSGRQLGLR